MKTLKIVITILVVTLSFNYLKAQQKADSIRKDTFKLYVVTKNDGNEYVGKIVKSDAHEVIVFTKDLGEVAIPKHEIKEIKQVKSGELNKYGNYIQALPFPSHYNYTTSALALGKGESYCVISDLGPQFAYGINDRVTFNVGTSWYAIPLIVGIKYSYPINSVAHLAVGVDALSGGWLLPATFGILPFVALTEGNSRANLTISGGYAGIGGNIYGSDISGHGQGYMSLAGMKKISKKVDFVFESVVFPNIVQTGSTLYFINPGIRVQTGENRAWQFSLAGAGVDGNFVPIPDISFMIKL